MNNKIYCEHHQTFHDLELIERFAAKTNKLGDKCPIAAAMEVNEGSYIFEPEYTILHKAPTEVKWPVNIDFLLTKLPSTEKEGFSPGLIGFIANRAYQSMNNNSLAYIVVSSYKEQKERPYQIVEIFKSAGFEFIDTIIWSKNKYTPTQGGKRLNNVYDFVFQFSKGENYHLNRESIAYLRKEEGDYLCAGNIWHIKVDEKDSVPRELVDCAIKLSNLIPNSLIADPFMGSGAVLQAALNNQHSFWGIETDQLKYKRCQKIVKDYQNTLVVQNESATKV